jgi:DNA-binding SARP family transcriptional activator
MPSRRNGVPSRPGATRSRRRSTGRLCLLGGFELLARGAPQQPPVHVQRLVAFLALQRHPLQRAYVAGHLWFELSQEHANGCLRSTIWRMSRYPQPLVEATSTHLALDASVSVDARELDATAQRVIRSNGTPAGEDVDCLARADDLMPDWYDDWVLQERDRLRQIRLLALEAASESLIGARRYAEGAIAALAVVDTDPLRESAYRLLIRAYVGNGNIAEALHQFAIFRARLSRALGLEPSPQMLELVSRIT